MHLHYRVSASLPLLSSSHNLTAALATWLMSISLVEGYQSWPIARAKQAHTHTHTYTLSHVYSVRAAAYGLLGSTFAISHAAAVLWRTLAVSLMCLLQKQLELCLAKESLSTSLPPYLSLHLFPFLSVCHAPLVVRGNAFVVETVVPHCLRGGN